MFNFEQEANLVNDREDLIAVLKMRFGSIAPGIVDKIYELDSLDAIERLILVAANAPDLKTFLTELEAGEDSYKIVGDQFNPLGLHISGGENDGSSR